MIMNSLALRIREFLLSRLYAAQQEIRQLRRQLEDSRKQEALLQNMVSETYQRGAEVIKSLTKKLAEADQQRLIHDEQIAELTELAITDQLTGLLSRRGMLSRFHGQINAIERTMSTHSSSDYPKVCALFVDVDKFKAVNDTLGHNGGDGVLLALAAVMKAGFRTEDILCRLGGDEFLVILPHADIEKAYLKAEKFQQQLNADARMAPQGKQTTVSIGIAELDFKSYDDVDLALKNAMALADQAMYRAKAKGRNMIVRLDD